MSDQNPMEFVTRAQLVKNRVDMLSAEARTAPLSRQEAIRDEVALCLRSLQEIREEQLLSMLPSPKPKRRWWPSGVLPL